LHDSGSALLPAAAADYNLLVYGSLTFDAGYVERCRGLIIALGLTKNVELRGLGKPTAVLAQGWCYLQVSCAAWPIVELIVAPCALKHLHNQQASAQAPWL
jgi:hypothetical protein